MPLPTEPGAAAAMAMLYEFLPLILFLIALIAKDIYVAAMVLMVTMPIGLAVKSIRTRKLDRMYLWSTLLVELFGGATLYFRNPQFLFWKPTAFYWALAAACLVSQFAGDRPLVQRFFGMVGELNTDKLTPRQWTQLNLAWIVFFAALGVVNIYVAYNFSIEIWGTFKVFGLFGLTLLFVIGQSIWIVTKLGDAAPDEQQEEHP
jgi:intracellular septation protein